jgi:hypothetical protein
MAKAKNPIEDIVSRAQKFVEKQKGRWDHAAWEKLVKDVSSSGIEMSDDTRRHLGNMLESVKHFYTELSKPEAKKKAAAKKKKSGAKKKSTSKKKAASKPKTAAKKKAASKKKKPAAKKA